MKNNLLTCFLKILILTSYMLRFPQKHLSDLLARNKEELYLKLVRRYVYCFQCKLFIGYNSVTTILKLGMLHLPLLCYNCLIKEYNLNICCKLNYFLIKKCTPVHIHFHILLEIYLSYRINGVIYFDSLLV